MITLALTGASGAQYGIRLLECLLKSGTTVYLVVSKAAQVVITTETTLQLPDNGQASATQLQTYFDTLLSDHPGTLKVLALDDWMSPIASGTSAPKKMIVCPCSGGTLSAIASGASNNLIERAADVVIKERNQLVLVTREMPCSAIHLEHMLKLSRLGVAIMPASPGFYQLPKTVADLVDFVVARVLDQIDMPQDLLKPWGS